jgi:DNA-binding transcriptional MocR family regulator
MGMLNHTIPERGMQGREATRTSGVMAAVRRKLSSRALAAGDRLPSIRSFAATMGVSPSTVVEAYDRLAAEGLIRARRGSGFYVVGTGLPPMTLAQAGPRRDRAVDPFWVSRQSLDANPAVMKPGCGWLPTDWMPNTALRRALRTLARGDDATLTEYGSTRGSPTLAGCCWGGLPKRESRLRPNSFC